MGFTFEDCPKADETTPGTPSPLATMKRLVADEPHSSNRIFPYLGGEEFNSHPEQRHNRYAVNFGEMTEADCRSGWPQLFSHLERKVKAERQKNAHKNVTAAKRAAFWWVYGSTAKELQAALAGLSRCIAIPFVSKWFTPSFVPAATIVAGPANVIADDRMKLWALVQSRAHEEWVALLSSSLEERQRYTPSDCFETFPFPENFETDAALEVVGKTYYQFRADLMVRNNEGLTKTYNRFHDPAEPSADIARLRDLHAEMDRAVLAAYDWKDVPTTCGFALDWLDLDDDELANTLAEAPDDVRERIESADYFFPDAASACRFQSHIKKQGRGKLPWRHRWPDDVRARLLALNAERAEAERLAGLSAPTRRDDGDDSGDDDGADTAPDGDDDSSGSDDGGGNPSNGNGPSRRSPRGPRAGNMAKKASKRAAKRSAPRPLLPDDGE